MKKLIAIAIMSLANIAGAENWTVVSESTDGIRLLIDTDSLTIQEWADKTAPTNKIPWAIASFVYFKTGEGPSDPVLFTTKLQSCDNKGGEVILEEKDNTSKFHITSRFWWSVNGKRVYDDVGQALCLLTDAKLQDMQPKSNKNKHKDNI